MGKARLGTKEQPAKESQGRRHHHGWNKVRSGAIREPLHWRAAALRFAHELHDLRKRGFAAHALRFHDEAAAGIQRAASDRVTGALFDGHRFARDHRFIHRARAFANHAVHGNAFARADAQPVAAIHLIERHVFFSAICRDEMRLLRREIQQRADRSASSLPRAQFQYLTKQHECRDHCGGFEINRHGAIHAVK